MTTPEKKIITPTVGRKVWFRPNGVELPQLVNAGGILPARPSIYGSQPLDATVVYVWGRLVNLAVIDHDGNHFTATSVPLLQEGDEKPARGFYCEWMPYQTAQAKKESAVPMAPPLASPATRRENIEQILVSAAAAYIAENPSNAGKIADGINTALNAVMAGGKALPIPAKLPDYNPGPDSLEREIQAKANKAPRVTPAALQAEIVSAHYFTASDGVVGATAALTGQALGGVTYEVPPLHLLTFCVLVLKNGFTVVGQSACASPENFNAEIGQRIARENAEREIWPLLGFRLRDELARPVLTDADAAADLAGTPRPG